MPIPREKETQEEFHVRCMAHEHTQRWNPKQRNAVCYALWVDAHPQSKEAELQAERTEGPLKVERATDSPLTVTEGGEISGYACTWAFNKDGIQFEPGAFKKTLAERSGKIPMTLKHTSSGSSVLETVGWVIKGVEDAVGLFVTGKFLDTPLAQAVRTQAVAKGVKGFSILAPVLHYNLIGGIMHATEAMLQDVTLTNTPLDTNAMVSAVRDGQPTAPVTDPVVTVPAVVPPVITDTPDDVIRRESRIALLKVKDTNRGAVASKKV